MARQLNAENREVELRKEALNRIRQSVLSLHDALAFARRVCVPDSDRFIRLTMQDLPPIPTFERVKLGRKKKGKEVDVVAVEDDVEDIDADDDAAEEPPTHTDNIEEPSPSSTSPIDP